MKKSKVFILDGVKIAMAYIGTVIGAGFATGQEILQFFTKLGYNSIYAILVATLLFILVGLKILLLGNKLSTPSYGKLVDRIFGPVSPLVNIYLALTYLLICAAMFAGAGALLKELFGVPYIIGALFIALTTLIVSLSGIRGILAANGFIVPLIVAFTFIIFIRAMNTKDTSIVANQLSLGEIFPLLRAALSYASFNLILSIGVLAPLGASVRDTRSLYIGSILGGGILGLLMLFSNTSMLYYVPVVFNRELPIIAIIEGLGRGFILAYGAIIWLEIFSTAIGNLFSIDTVIRDKLKTKSSLPAIVLSGLSLLLCLFGFSNIVKWFYPALGVLGFVLVGMIFIYS